MSEVFSNAWDWVRDRAHDLMTPDTSGGTATGILGDDKGSIRRIDPACAEDAYACTDINPETGQVETGYTCAFNGLDPVSQRSVDIHEGVHVPQAQEYLHWWRPDSWSRTWLNNARERDPAKFEVPALTAQVDFLTRHVTDANNPYDARVWNMWYAKQAELDKYKGAKR